MEPWGDVNDQPSESDMRFVDKRRSARLLVLRRALQGELGNYHATNWADLHREMTELRLFRPILL
jgi:hypothetical protein